MNNNVYCSISSRLKREVKQANLQRKRCADGHENNDFDITTVSMLKLSPDSKGYDVKNSYVLRSRFGLLNLTIALKNAQELG